MADDEGRPIRKPSQPRDAGASPDHGALAAQHDVGEADAPGWRQVLTLGAAVVMVVLALAVLTSVLPAPLQDVVFHTPVAIVVLLVGTVGLLLWVARRPSPRV